MNTPPPNPNAPTPRRRWQFTLLRLFRIQLGVAGLAAVVAYLNQRETSPMLLEIQPGVFVFLCGLSSAVAYLFARHFLPRRRLPAWVASVYIAGAAGSSLAGSSAPGFDLALLGAAVGVSWLVALGWIDAGSRGGVTSPATTSSRPPDRPGRG